MPETEKNRRGFLKAAGAASAAALVAACDGQSDTSAGAPAVAKRQTKNLKMVTTWPKNFPGLGVSAERLAKRISEATDGAIRIKVYAGGELVPPFGAFDAVSQGKADIYNGAEYYWQGKSKAFNFFASVPFGMTASELAAWVYHMGGQELWDELAGGFNIKPFLLGNTGVQMGGWFRSEIASLEDFKGLRMRIPGLGGEVIKRLGATPVTKAGGEIFLALSQGNIDATEWVGPWNDLSFGFHEIAKYYYYPGFHETGTAAAVGFNTDVWNSFSKSDQAIIQNAILAESEFVTAEFNAQNARALDTLINKHGVQLRRFSDDILTEIGRVAAEVLAETAAEDELTGRVYESFVAARTSTARWGEIGEHAFREARALLKA